MSVIALLDCAMRIYSNFPCRLLLAELQNDLPCKEAIFSSRHPFMQDESIFATRLSICQAFSLLFEGKGKANESAESENSSQADSAGSMMLPDDPDSKCDLTVFDLFILIHCKATNSTNIGKG